MEQMKNSSTVNCQAFAFRHRHSRGVALILVLASLVLLTILVLAFLTGVGSELQSSKMYANGSSGKLLAQSAVALVTGEIQAATADQALCWASQPGMIRTYKNDGTASGFYKLYSDDTMIGTGAFDHTATANLVPSTWYTQKGVYVDLNQPVTFNSANYYPILDGNSSDYTTTYANTLSTLTTPTATASIKSLKVNSSTALVGGLPGVTGYWLNSNTPVDSTSPNVAPMPVKWLYVLQNGEVIVPDSSPVGGVVTFKQAKPDGVSNQPLPSSSNPIVGRMAYWTDDESTKVNINTASEGTFWDTPRCYSASDYDFATYQPVQNEMQRYPGHPATVSLSAVFNGLKADANFPENFYPITPRISAGGSMEGRVTTAAVAGALSVRSSRLYSSANDLLFQDSITGLPGAGTRNLNSFLLAATTELDAAALDKAKFFLTANSTAPDVNLFNLPRVSMWPITLTGGNVSSLTQSTTAFDKLIAFCSTINANKYYFQRWDSTSALNDLPSTGLASNAGNPLARNRDLLEYLRTLTSLPVPGFGGSFKDKYKLPDGSPADRDQILVEMFDYIRSTNTQDSSTGATVFAKSLGTTAPYTSGGIGQIVPIQDSTVTIKDTVGGANNNPRGFGRFPTIQQACLVFIGAGNSSTPVLPASTTPNPVSSYTPVVAGGKERVQAGFFFQMFDPSEGIPVTRPWYQIKVSHLENLLWNGQSIFPTGTTFPYLYNSNGTVRPTASDAFAQNLPGSSVRGFSGLSYGGMLDFRLFSILRGSTTGGSATANGGYGSPLYPFISPPTGQTTPLATAPDMTQNGTFAFTTSGDVTVEIYALDASGTPSATPIQTLALKFPDGTFPVPTSINNDGTTTAANPVSSAVPSGTPVANYPNYNFLSMIDGTKRSGTTGGFTVTDNKYGNGYGRLNFQANSVWVNSKDVIRGIVASDPSVSTSSASAGDVRLLAARQTVPSTFFQPITGSGFPATADYTSSANHFSHFLRILTGYPIYGSIGGKLIHLGTSAATNYSIYSAQFNNGSVSTANPDSTFAAWSGSAPRPKDPLVANQSSNVLVGNDTTKAIPGDWDNGFQNSPDGAYINKADEGDAGTWDSSTSTYAVNGYPYFELDYGSTLPGATFFSPNRMIPSPVMFGSLPSGVWSNKAWQTLLFRPGPANHPGLGTISSGSAYTTPPDHLLLDLFNMPVVEPYAISTPLATAGRINMNYLIVPFTYINRDTGLRAVMKSQMITAIPNSQIRFYKIYQNTAGGANGGGAIPAAIAATRYTINLDYTLSQFLARFYAKSGTQGSTGTPDIFHSASEICQIELVPNDTVNSPGSMPVTRTKMDTYWAKNAITGDNSRERPYANIYPLLTTKSNTFTVHYRVQTLKQALTSSATATAWQSWREGTDIVTAENRGSQTIERYIDPNDTIPDYASLLSTTAAYPPSSTQALSNYYKFRVVSSTQFPP